jgi:hypothetical protein
MAVLPQTPEVADDPGKDPAAELAELRRRAYGPDADIEADAEARARLQELEDELRAASRPPSAVDLNAEEATPVVAGSSPAEQAPDAATEPDGPVDAADLASVTGESEADGGASATTPVDTEPEASGLRGFVRRMVPSLRERRTWIIGGVGALIGAAVAVGLFAYPWNGPDQVLHPQADQPRFLPSEYADFLLQLGAKDDTEVAFETVGGFTPWSIDLEAGGRCILVTEGSRNLVNMACAAAGMDPVLDLLPGLWGDRSAQSGRTLRFIAREDRVEVWFGGPQPTTDSAASARIS